MKYLLSDFETERLRFRLLEDHDFEDWLPLFYDKQAATFLALDPNLAAEELCRNWFTKIYSRYQNDLGGMNVLVEKSSNRMVGQCGLLVQTVEEETCLEIGYSLLPEFRGRGFATEAARACRDQGFARKYSEELISIVHIENTTSAAVAKNNGMNIKKFDVKFKKNPVNIFAITHKQWTNLYPQRK